MQSLATTFQSGCRVTYHDRVGSKRRRHRDLIKMKICSDGLWLRKSHKRCIYQFGRNHKKVLNRVHQLLLQLGRLRLCVRIRSDYDRTTQSLTWLTWFPLSDTLSYFYDFASRFMSRTTLIRMISVEIHLGFTVASKIALTHLVSHHHGIANPSMLPEMNIAPTSVLMISCITMTKDQIHLPANTSGTDVYKNLARARFQSRLLHNMYLMLRIVKCCDIGITRRLLVWS